MAWKCLNTFLHSVFASIACVDRAADREGSALKCFHESMKCRSNMLEVDYSNLNFGTK